MQHAQGLPVESTSWLQSKREQSTANQVDPGQPVQIENVSCMDERETHFHHTAEESAPNQTAGFTCRLYFRSLLPMRGRLS